MQAPALQVRLSQRPLYVAGLLLLALVLIAAWPVTDFWRERQRILADAARMAVQQSQLMGRSFGDTFLATDYVLRDVIGRVDLAKDLTYPHPDTSTSQRLDTLLKEKITTVVGLSDLVLLNGDCLFVAVAMYPFRGTKSRQNFCTESHVTPGQSLRIQYMPQDKSVSQRPVVLISRIVGSAEGRLLGAAMAVIDLEYAQQWIAALAVDHHDVLTIVDTNGTLLARNPFQPQSLGRRTSSPSGQPSFAEIGDAATFIASSPIDGRERVFGLSRLARFPFVAIVGLDKTRVLAGWQRRAWQFSAGFVVLALCCVVALRAHLAAVRQAEAMRVLATTDALTGIANRRHLIDIGNQAFVHANHDGQALSVLMLDIDKFKSVNDRWGHATGDRVIQTMAQLIASTLRDQDTGGRLGGEEFAVILPATDVAEALTRAEQLRHLVQSSEVLHTDGTTMVKFTTSIGIASLMPGDGSFNALLQRADRALYRAKHQGRNCSMLAELT
ncbi:diguanylate cyclase [Giesbergeria sinuosa]|uniref:diguanylate cyclase n=1 Tax=Giesbergeria sinuosa TaxID=80883 RepID=A0ABV9QCN2_9BURK